MELAAGDGHSGGCMGEWADACLVSHNLAFPFTCMYSPQVLLYLLPARLQMCLSVGPLLCCRASWLRSFKVIACGPTTWITSPRCVHGTACACEVVRAFTCARLWPCNCSYACGSRKSLIPVLPTDLFCASHSGIQSLDV